MGGGQSSHLCINRKYTTCHVFCDGFLIILVCGCYTGLLSLNIAVTTWHFIRKVKEFGRFLIHLAGWEKKSSGMVMLIWFLYLVFYKPFCNSYWLKEYMDVFIMHDATSKNAYVFGVISFYPPFLCFFPLLLAARTFQMLFPR